LHVLAALKHHVVDRDRLLERMWPGRTIKVTLLTALPAVSQQRKAPKVERKAKAAAKRRRARRRGERAAAV